MRWFQRYVVHELHPNGVSLLLGIDTFGFTGVAPGISTHEELKLLQESGLPIYDDLLTATVNPAIFLIDRASLARLWWENDRICFPSAGTRWKASNI